MLTHPLGRILTHSLSGWILTHPLGWKKNPSRQSVDNWGWKGLSPSKRDSIRCVSSAVVQSGCDPTCRSYVNNGAPAPPPSTGDPCHTPPYPHPTPGERAPFGMPLSCPLIQASTGRRAAYLAGGGLRAPKQSPRRCCRAAVGSRIH
jgi:hypothetical protein